LELLDLLYSALPNFRAEEISLLFLLISASASTSTLTLAYRFCLQILRGKSNSWRKSREMELCHETRPNPADYYLLNPPVAKIVLHLEGRYDEKVQPATPYSPQLRPANLLVKYTEREMYRHVYHN